MKSKEEIISKWSNFWILNPNNKELTRVFEMELSEHAKEVSVEFFLWYFKEYKVDTSKEMSVEDVFDLFRKERGL